MDQLHADRNDWSPKNTIMMVRAGELATMEGFDFDEGETIFDDDGIIMSLAAGRHRRLPLTYGGVEGSDDMSWKLLATGIFLGCRLTMTTSWILTGRLVKMGMGPSTSAIRTAR